MTEAELVQVLKLVNGQRVTIAMIAEIADVSRQSIYNGLKDGFTAEVRDRLIAAIQQVEKRGYHIPRAAV